MFGNRGIVVDAFARIEHGCPINYQVVANEAEFTVGTSDAYLSLVFTERGLEETARAMARALKDIRIKQSS